MDTILVTNCFLSLKKVIGEFYGKNSKAVTDNKIDFMSILRQCDKMEFALKGDVDQVVEMDVEDALLYRKTVDKQYEDYVNGTNTVGATPEAKAYAASVRAKKLATVKWVTTRGRVEAARQIFEDLKKEEQVALAELNTINGFDE